MTAFARERSDADWYRGLKVPAAVLLNIDEKTKKAISGTGGTWTPSSAIILGGAGLELQCAAQLSGGATVFPAAGKNYKFGDDDYFTFASPVSRVIHDSSLQNGNNWTRREADIYGLGTTTARLRTRRRGAFLRMPIRVPDGARLSNVEIGFMVGVAHANVPATLPTARVVQIAADGTVTKYPNQTNSTADPNGWVSSTRPATGVLWYAAGAVQTLNLTFDSAVGTQDRAARVAYDYAVEWIEESGVGAFDDAVTGEVGNSIAHLRVTVLVPDLRPY